MNLSNRTGKSDALAPDAVPGPATSETPRRNPLLVLWYRRWIVVICPLVALICAFIYLRSATPIWESNAKVRIEQNTTRIISNESGGIAAGGTQNFLWTECAVISSRDFLKKVTEEPGIRELESFPPGKNPVNELIGMVSPGVGRRDDIITISVRSKVRDDAKRIADAIVVAYIKHQAGSKRSDVRDLLDLLTHTQVANAKDLDEKRKAMLELQTKNASFTIGNQQFNPTIEGVSRLEAALLQKQLEKLEAQSTYDLAKAMLADPQRSRQLLESRQFKTETASLRQDLRQLQSQLATFGQNLASANPTMVALRQGVDSLYAQMELEDRKIVEAYVFELGAKVEEAKLAEEKIQAKLNEQREQLIQMNRVAAAYSMLQSEIASIEAFNQTIYTRLRELSVTEESGARNIQTVQSAVEPQQVEPRAAASYALSLLVGGALGVLLAFVRDWMDQRLRSADEIKQVTGLPVLGVVPHIVDGRSVSQRGMFLHQDPMSDVAEAYRTVRTAVYFGQAGVAKTLLITSPSPGDGKSTLASNLAISMAQAGNRILLLDADFRKPTQHKIFELDKRLGLSSVLAGEITLPEAIHHTSVPNLDVLPCGPIPANPSEILNSQTFADLLGQLSAEYDHVLLDSPPVMPVTDARILAASCDATVIALRAERSTRKGATYSRDMLQSVGSQILGVVVNDVPRRKGVYGYYYTYGEQYQYGYGNRKNGATAAGGKDKGSAPITGNAETTALKRQA